MRIDKVKGIEKKSGIKCCLMFNAMLRFFPPVFTWVKQVFKSQQAFTIYFSRLFINIQDCQMDSTYTCIIIFLKNISTQGSLRAPLWLLSISETDLFFKKSLRFFSIIKILIMALKKIFLTNFFLHFYLFLRDRQSTGGGGAESKGDRI